jgi:hypothetical protein
MIVNGKKRDYDNLKKKTLWKHEIGLKKWN